jgi:hypothetical protein
MPLRCPMMEPNCRSSAMSDGEALCFASLAASSNQILDIVSPEGFQSRYLPGRVSVNAAQNKRVAAAAAAPRTKNPGK